MLMRFLDLERALQQVGYGTGREDDFDNAIVMEDIEGEYVFSFESDGSMPARGNLQQSM